MTVKIDGTNTTANPGITGADTDTGLQFGTNEVKVVTGGSDRATVDSSGNVLVGKTSSSGLNAGCEFRPAGMGLFTRDSANPVQVRRLTDDGDLVEFYKDSNLRGSVGVSGSSLNVGVAGATRLTVDSSRVGIGTTSPSDANSNADDLVIKATGSGAGITIFSDTDNFGNIYFGDSSSAAHRGRVRYDHSTDALTFSTAATERCRILSSGGLTFNGDTSQVNALDDYEEGTWTATLVTGTCTSNSGKYIKIGNFIRVSATLYGFSNRTSTNLVQINNAPYASSTAQVAQAAGSMFGRYIDRTGFSSYMSSTGNIEFYSIGSGNWAALEHQHLNNSQTSMYFQASWYID